MGDRCEEYRKLQALNVHEQLNTSMGVVKNMNFGPRCNYMSTNQAVGTLAQEKYTYGAQCPNPYLPTNLTNSGGYGTQVLESCGSRCPQTTAGVGRA